jgi:hypothetical protein
MKLSRVGDGIQCHISARGHECVVALTALGRFISDLGLFE